MSIELYMICGLALTWGLKDDLKLEDCVKQLQEDTFTKKLKQVSKKLFLFRFLFSIKCC